MLFRNVKQGIYFFRLITLSYFVNFAGINFCQVAKKHGGGLWVTEPAEVVEATIKKSEAATKFTYCLGWQEVNQ
jgi:hypothetical protein